MTIHYQNQVHINICNRCHQHPCTCNKRASHNNCKPNNHYYYNNNIINPVYSQYNINPINQPYSTPQANTNSTNCIHKCNCNQPVYIPEPITCNNVNKPNNCTCKCKNKCCTNKKCSCNGLFWLALALLII